MNLEAYRRGRLADAGADAARLTAEADAIAVARLAEGRRTAEAIVAQAQVEGVAEADREMARTRVRERRRAQRIVLGARRQAYETLSEGARAAVRDLRPGSAPGAFLDRLERLAREQLGDGARVERDLVGVGGVVAEFDGRRVDYSLAALAERCLRGLRAEVEELWR